MLSAGTERYSPGAVQGDIVLRTENPARKLILNAGGTNDVLVVAKNNVGINTTNPLYPLDISVSDAPTPTAIRTGLRITRLNSVGNGVNNLGIGIALSVENGASAPVEAGRIEAVLEDANENGVAVFRGISSLRFYTKNSVLSGFSNGLSEVMRINGSGYVGIGTTAPKEKLDVNGSVIANGSLMLGRYAVGMSPSVTPGYGTLYYGTSSVDYSRHLYLKGTDYLGVEFNMPLDEGLYDTLFKDDKSPLGMVLGSDWQCTNNQGDRKGFVAINNNPGAYYDGYSYQYYDTVHIETEIGNTGHEAISSLAIEHKTGGLNAVDISSEVEGLGTSAIYAQNSDVYRCR